MNTGRIYIQNLDNANAQSPFKDKISMSNLCQEILTTTEFSDINSEEGEIALCMLGGINLEF
jgi:ribonucleoside-diphosphate reductase alpha chain